MTQETDPAQSAAEVAEAAATRAANALKLRKLRVSYDDIAKQLGYANRSGAYKAVQKALQDITREPAKELIELELDTLDMMQSALAKRIMAGDDIAINTGLKIMGQRAKLTGLYEASEDTSNLAEIRAALLGFKEKLGEADLGDGSNDSGSHAPRVDEPEAGAVGP